MKKNDKEINTALRHDYYQNFVKKKLKDIVKNYSFGSIYLKTQILDFFEFRFFNLKIQKSSKLKLFLVLISLNILKIFSLLARWTLVRSYDVILPKQLYLLRKDCFDNELSGLSYAVFENRIRFIPVVSGIVKKRKVFVRKIFFRDIRALIAFASILISKKTNSSNRISVLNLMCYLLKYSIEADFLKTDVYIDTKDNRYNSLKYSIYKNNIRKIILLQNGIRSGNADILGGGKYTAADCYIGFSSWQERVIQPSYIKKYLKNGSYSLGVFFENNKELINKVKRIKKRYSAVYIESFSYDSDQHFNVEDHLISVKHFFTYALSKKNENFVYCSKFNEHTEFILKRIQVTIPRNVDFVEKQTYKFCSNSEIAVTHSSTAVYESLVLGCKILVCNYSRLSHLHTDKSGLSVIYDSNYETFRDALNNFLSGDKLKITNNFYFSLSKKLFSQEHNYFQKLIEEIRHD